MVEESQVIYRGGQVVTAVEADIIDEAERVDLAEGIIEVASSLNFNYQKRFFDAYIVRYKGYSAHCLWYMKELFRRTSSEQFRAYILKRAIEVFLSYGGGEIRSGVEKWFRSIGPDLSDEVRAEIQGHQDRVAQAVAPLLGGSCGSGGDQVED